MVEFNPGVKVTNLENGGTKKVTVSYHEADERFNEPSLWNIVTEYDYDGDGKVDEMLIEDYNEDKSLKDSERRTYKYNKNGQTTYESYDRGNDGSIEHDISWKYDAQGRLIERKDGGTEGKGKITVKYTNDGRIVDNDTNADGTVDYRTVESKNKTVNYVNKNGKLVYDGESRYGRDSNGAIIGDHYNKDGYSHSTGPDAHKHPHGFGL